MDFELPYRYRSWLAIITALAVIAGCYHLRPVATPLKSYTFFLQGSPAGILATIGNVLREDGFIVEEEAKDGAALVTSTRIFYNDSGFSQPAGGRNYYCRLNVILQQRGTLVAVTLEPLSLAMASTYVYDADGKAVNLSKRYPYEEYPGMFELGYLDQELLRVMTLLQRNMR